MRSRTFGHQPFSLRCWCLPSYVWIETLSGPRRRWMHNTVIRGGC